MNADELGVRKMLVALVKSVIYLVSVSLMFQGRRGYCLDEVAS